MGERTSYAPGTFCWVELATPDPAGAKSFYSALFGWEPHDTPLGAGTTYTMLRLRDRDVGALYEQAAEQRAQAPPSWLSYVSVTDVDGTVVRAAELGANVMAGPFDVIDAGRMAVLADPQGVVFALWQPREHFGAGIVNDPGALTMNQLNTSDPGGAQRFYADLFGWRVEFVGTEDQDYWGIYNGETLNGGMMALPPGAPVPPHWLAFFTIEDIDAAARRIEELGGQIVVPITPIPSGRILVAQDPQGAAFALFEGEIDP